MIRAPKILAADQRQAVQRALEGMGFRHHPMTDDWHADALTPPTHYRWDGRTDALHVINRDRRVERQIPLAVSLGSDDLPAKEPPR
jgi:hypothetical protein